MWGQIAAWQTSLHPLTMFSRMYKGWKNILGAFWWHEGECWESFDIFLACFSGRPHWLLLLPANSGENILWPFFHLGLKIPVNSTFIHAFLILKKCFFQCWHLNRRDKWSLWHHKGLANLLTKVVQAKEVRIMILMSWLSALANGSYFEWLRN